MPILLKIKVNKKEKVIRRIIKRDMITPYKPYPARINPIINRSSPISWEIIKAEYFFISWNASSTLNITVFMHSKMRIKAKILIKIGEHWKNFAIEPEKIMKNMATTEAIENTNAKTE